MVFGEHWVRILTYCLPFGITSKFLCSMWPPETHYRCVEAEGCNYNLDIPPTTEEGKWAASQKFGKEPVPLISRQPCESHPEL